MNSTPLSLLQKLQGTVRPEAWKRFVYIYAPLLDRWAVRLGLQDADRADLIQDVLIVLLHSLPTFHHNGRGSFRAWLQTIVRNKWTDHCRKRIPTPLENGDQRWKSLVDENALLDFEQTEYCRFIAGRVLHLIKSEFQTATWNAFWETVVEGRPTDEVAREQGLTVNAVYLARGRVLRRLRGELCDLLD